MNKHFLLSGINFELLEQGSKPKKDPELLGDKDITPEELSAKIQSLKDLVVQKDLQIYGSMLDAYKNQVEQLGKKIDKTEKKIDRGGKGLFGNKQERLANKQERKQDQLEEINNKIAGLELELEQKHGIVSPERAQQALRNQVHQDAQTLYVGSDGKIHSAHSGKSGDKQYSIGGKDAVAAFSEIQKDPKKFLDYGRDKTVTGGLLKYTNTTPKQAQLIATVAFFFLLRKGYTALRDNVFKGSNIRTLAAVFAGSWMATGMQPRQLAMAFKKSGINGKTQKDFADLFDVESMRYETDTRMETLSVQESLTESLLYGLKNNQLLEQYYNKKDKKFEVERLYADIQAKETDFLVKGNNPQAPENNQVMQMITLLHSYQQKNELTTLGTQVGDYLEKLSAQESNKFDLGYELDSGTPNTTIKQKFETAQASYRVQEDKKVQQEQVANSNNKLKKIDPQGMITFDAKNATTLAAVNEVLQQHEGDNLNDPQIASTIKQELAKLPGITIAFPKQNEEDAVTSDKFLQGNFNKVEYDWLTANNNLELNKFKQEFLTARQKVYSLTGSTIQLSTQGGSIFLEAEYNGKDRKVELLLPSRTEMRISGCSGSLAAGGYEDLFMQGAIMALIIAECEGSGSPKEKTPFSVNTIAKGIDYNKQGTSVSDYFSSTKIHSVKNLLPLSSRRNNLKGLVDVLNGPSFIAPGTKTTTRDDGKTSEIEQPTIWMGGMSVPARFKGIKNTEGYYYDSTDTGENVTTSTDYTMLDATGDAITGTTTAIGASMSKGREGIKEFFGGQPDDLFDGKYISSFADYEKQNGKITLAPNTSNMSPSQKLQQKQATESQIMPIKTYVYGKIVNHKEYSYAFSALYGFILSESSKPAGEKTLTNSDGTPNIAARKAKLESIKPGIGSLFNTSDGLRAKALAAGYPERIFPADMFTDMVTRYSQHAAQKDYHDNTLAQAEVLVSGVWKQIGDGTKRIINDLADGTIDLTGDVMGKINDGLSGIGDNMGTKILGGIGALWGAGKLKALIQGK